MSKDHNDIQSTVWRNDVLKGIDFCATEYAKFAFTPHFHEHYVFYVVKAGVNQVDFQKKKYIVPKGEVLIINPGDVHTGSSYDAQPLTYRSLCIDQSFFTKVLQDMHLDTEPPAFSSFHIKDKRLTDKILRILNYSDAGHEEFALESACADLFGYALKLYSSDHRLSGDTDKTKSKVQDVTDFIKANYDRNFSLAELSGYMQLSQYHLIRAFKIATGLTPYEYLRNYRIEQGKLLLKQTSRSITDIALSLGFYDQSHFQNHFKRLIGVTPRQFQQG